MNSEVLRRGLTSPPTSWEMGVGRGGVMDQNKSDNVKSDVP